MNICQEGADFNYNLFTPSAPHKQQKGILPGSGETLGSFEKAGQFFHLSGAPSLK